MGLLIDDTVLDTFAVTGEPETVGRTLHERFGGLCTRITVSFSHETDDTLALDVLAGVRI